MTAAGQRSLAQCGELHDMFLSIFEDGLHAGVIAAARVTGEWSAPWRALLFGFHPKLHYLPTGPIRLAGQREREKSSETEWLRWLANEDLPAPVDISTYRLTCRDLLIQWLEHHGCSDVRAALERRDRLGTWSAAETPVRLS